MGGMAGFTSSEDVIRGSGRSGRRLIHRPVATILQDVHLTARKGWGARVGKRRPSNFDTF